MRPGRIHYASSGVGSANHVDTEVFAAIAGIELTHVPYRGTADGYRALLVDEVQVMFGAVTSALPHVRSGKVRALAVLTDIRSPVLPEVPTLVEAGLDRVDVRKWLGLLAPAGTAPEACQGSLDERTSCGFARNHHHSGPWSGGRGLGRGGAWT